MEVGNYKNIGDTSSFPCETSIRPKEERSSQDSELPRRRSAVSLGDVYGPEDGECKPLVAEVSTNKALFRTATYETYLKYS